MQVKIIGAGLAGCEAALWMADRGALQHAARERLDIQLAPRHLAEGQEIA